MPGTTTLGLPTYGTGDSAEPLDAILTDISQAADDAIQDRTPMDRIVRLRRAATLSTPASTNTNVPWDTEDSDPAGMITVTSADITIPAGAGGIYSVHGLVRWNAFTSGNGACWITVNGSQVLDGPSQLNQGAGLGVQAAVDGLITVTAGQVVRMVVLQTSAGSVSCTARLHMVWVRP